MGILDVYYRGFIDYRKNTDNDKAVKRERKILAKANDAFEKFIVTKYQIEIDEEWVKEIEKGLEFVEKAVKEERQFIRTNGEIVPIEKVKKVSRDSVSHLARHSNMITHLPDDPKDTIVPDSIYMVEKLSDYAVYENRFVYMLLCYLRDFIHLRIKKITEIRMTYICDFELKRNIQTKSKSSSFQTIYHEERKDNPYPLDNKESVSILKRISDCQEIIMMLLNTNLMQEVSKAPMVKPPIVKTNVLKMNNNFKNSLALYDYIVNYKGDGYTSEEVTTNFVPMSDATLDEIMELPTLTYFLTYKYGNDLAEILKTAYLEEEENRRKKETKALLEQIKRLKKKVLESGQSMEEYMLLLEKRNRMLEEDSQELQKTKALVVELNKKIDLLNLEIEDLNKKIVELQGVIEEKLQEIAYLKQKYIDDMNALKKAHKEEIERINIRHQDEINDLNQKHDEEIELLNINHQEEINEIQDSYELQIENLNAQYTEEIDIINENHRDEIDQINNAHQEEIDAIKTNYRNELEEQINEYNEKMAKLQNDVKYYQDMQQKLISSNEEERNRLKTDISYLEDEKRQLIKDYDDKLHELESNYLSLIETNTNDFNNQINDLDFRISKAVTERNLMAAELRAIRVKHELLTPCEEYTSEERFTQLEEEFNAFNNFFKAQWKLTKKEIRKQLLWTKSEKKNQAVDDNGLSDSLTSSIAEEENKN